MKTTNSVRVLVMLCAPNSEPTRGSLCRNGTPAELCRLFSRMMPAMATVSPSCTVTWVEKDRFWKEGDLIWLDAAGACGELTFWLMTMVTMPLELMRARMHRVTPELRLDTVLVNCEVPLWVTPLTACEVSVGTSSPTFMEAVMLSVAIMLGAEITRVWLLVSDAVTAPRSS